MSRKHSPLKCRLERPLAFFDIEATGISPRADRIVELAIIKINPDGSQNSKRFLVNPEMPIPQEAINIHGISDQDVADCPAFREIAGDVLDFLTDCDLAGYNVLRYDIPMLQEEFKRADIFFETEDRRIIDVQRIYHRREPRDLSAALAFYCGELHLDAHGAEADVLATIRVLEGQYERYKDLPTDMEELSEYCDPRHPSWVDRSGRLKWENNEIVINFGRKKGETLRNLIANDPNFIKWMLRSDFPPDTRAIVTEATEGKWPDPPASDT